MSDEECEGELEFDSSGDPDGDFESGGTPDGMDGSDDDAVFESGGDPDSGSDGEFDDDGEELEESVITPVGFEEFSAPKEVMEESKKGRETVHKYEVILEKKLYSSIRKEVKELQKILFVDYFSASEIIKFYKWSRERALEAYCSVGRDEMFAKTGLDCFLIFGQEKDKGEEFECPICLDDVKCSRKVSISKCSHQLCDECIQDYFRSVERSRIKGTSKKIPCPIQGCDVHFNSRIVSFILKTRKKELKAEIVRNYVMENRLVKYCPHPNCGQYVSKLHSDVIIGLSSIMIDCECGRTYCFQCSYPEFHNPATCEQVKDWEKHLDEDTATLQWVELNSKPCPGCKVSIVKNGGCNMMHCGKCGIGFCWVCLKGNVSYGHTCIFRTQDEENEITSKRKSYVKQMKMLDSTQYFSSFKKWKMIKASRKKEKQNLYTFQKYELIPEFKLLYDASVVLRRARLIMLNCIVYFFYEFNRENYKVELIKEQCERELTKRKIFNFDINPFEKVDPSSSSSSSDKSKQIKKRQNVLSKKKRKKIETKMENEVKLSDGKRTKLKNIFEKLQRMKALQVKINTNKNLFICFLEQLEENTERLSHLLSMNIHKIKGNVRVKIQCLMKVLESLFETVEREMHHFEKDRELEKDIKTLHQNMDKMKEKKKKKKKKMKE